jgi:hypothetical protein
MVRENNFVFSLNKLTGDNQIIVVAIQTYRAQIQISDSAPYAKGSQCSGEGNWLECTQSLIPGCSTPASGPSLGAFISKKFRNW